MSCGVAEEVQRADPGARRMALGAVAIVVLLGVVLALRAGDLRAMLQTWLRGDPATVLRRARWLAAAAALVTVLPPALGGAVLWRLAARVRAAGRFPPPGMRVVRDVRVLEGDGARLYAAVCRAGAVVLFVAALATAAVFVWLAVALSHVGVSA